MGILPKQAGSPEEPGAEIEIRVQALGNSGRWAQAEREARTALRGRPRCARLMGALATALIPQGKAPEAESLTRQALELDPDSPSLLETLANSLSHQERKLPQAEEVVRGLLKGKAEAGRLRGRLALLLLKQGKQAEAEEAIRVLGAETPSDCLEDLARSLTRAGKWAAAEGVLRRLAGRSPGDQWADLLAASLFHQGKFDELGGILAPMASGKGIDNAGTARVLMLSDLLRRAGRSPQAERLLRRRLAARPGEEGVALRLAEELVRRGLLDEGAAVLRGVGRGRRSLKASLALGEILLGQGKWKEMQRVMRAAVRRPPPGNKGHGGQVDLFWAAVYACDFPNAEKFGERLLDRTRDFGILRQLLRPIGRPFSTALARIPEEFRRRCSAEAGAFKAARPRSPWGPLFSWIAEGSGGMENRPPQQGRLIARYAWMGLPAALWALERGWFREAITRLKGVCRGAEPENWRASCHIAEARACLGDFSGAMAIFDRTRDKVPPADRGGVLAWKGEVLLWAGRYKEALAELDEALRLGGEFAAGWKGAVLVQSGRWAESLAWFDAELESHPESAETRLWKAEALYRLGRFAEAAAELERIEGLGGEGNPFFIAVQGLVRGAMGNAGGMKSDFRDLAGALPAFKKVRAGSYGSRKSALERFLKSARGLRRGKHEMAISRTRRAVSSVVSRP